MPGRSPVVRAQLASVLPPGADDEPPSGEQRGDFFLLRLDTHIRDRCRKIFDGIQLAIVFDDSDAERREVDVQNIGAMTGRMHPPGMNRLNPRADCNVLADFGETRTGLTGTLRQRRLAGKLVREVILFGHQQRVLARGFR